MNKLITCYQAEPIPELSKDVLYSTIAHSRGVNRPGDLDTAIQPGILCPRCSIVRSKLSEAVRWRQYESLFTNFVLYRSAAELALSASKGCHLCTLIYYRLFQNWDPQGSNVDQVEQCIRLECALPRGSYIPLKLTVSPTHYRSLGYEQSQQVLFWKFYQESLDVPSPSISLFNASNSSVVVARQWLKHCISVHDHSRQVDIKDSPTPTRLIELGDTLR